MFAALKLIFLLSTSFPSTVALYSIPVAQYLLDASVLILQVSQMICSIFLVWLWGLIVSTELIDVISIILSLYISTKVFLDIISYEIVITWNNAESAE